MSTSSKFDLSSGSPDMPLHATGQRGSNLAASLDRSVSFHETMENPILSSLPSMSRSSSYVTEGDAVNFFQCLRFDPKVVAAEQKSNRQGDFKRHMSVALGTLGDDSPSVSSKGKLLPSPIPEEIKRGKAALRETSVKARERLKIFNEALSVFNKFFPSIPSKKRSRSDSFSNDRPNTLLSTDRSVLAPSLGKIGLQSQTMSPFEVEQQKLEERSKNLVPKKRTRTSMVDVKMDGRSSTLVRPSAIVDREREIARLANSGGAQCEDRSLSIGVDGWENSKMKKRRSGMKPDLSPTVALTRNNDGYREPRQGMLQRPPTDIRSKLNNDTQSFRPGVANGAMGIGKSDGISQQPGLVIRSSVPRTEPDSGAVLNGRKDRPIGSDKEKANLIAVNRASPRDSSNSDCPTPSSKINTSVRGPRSGSGTAPKLSPVVHRETAPSEWELSPCTNKPLVAFGVNNRKRTASTRSSSPPVAHWAGQRPQKISRIARRTNLIPIVPNVDEAASLDDVSDATDNRRLAGNFSQQVKVKGEPMALAALCESDDSEPLDIRMKEKGKKSDEIDEKAGQNVQKMSALILPTRKNKLLTGEDLGESIRRQGRSGRGFTPSVSRLPPTAEKLGNVGTGKQLRSTKLGIEKSETKTGRPPTRKLSDRKAYKRHKHMAASIATDFIVGSDDGHEELLTAATAVTNPAHALSSSFWKQKEPVFRLISDIDIAYLEQQGTFDSMAAEAFRPEALRRSPNPSSVNCISMAANGNGLVDSELEVGFAVETRDMTLCQRLISAIISDEDYTSGNDELEFDEYATDSDLGGEWQENGFNHLDNIELIGQSPLMGYKRPSMPEHCGLRTKRLGTPSMGSNSNFSCSINGQLSDQAPTTGITLSEHYNSMNMDEKLHLEVQSIGIFPEVIPARTQRKTGDISFDISKLEEGHNSQISKKNIMLNRLLKSASETMELQEKEFDRHAHDKLVTMACQKYMTCWGPNASGGKSSSSKMAKQAALEFVKRTLDRCHKFEDTGKSCFSEPWFKDILLSRPSQLNSSQSAGTLTDGESTKPYTNTFSRFLEGRASASTGSQSANLASRLYQNGDSYPNSSELLPVANRVSEQTTVKDDIWSNKVKKREIFLDDVVGGIAGASSNAPSRVAVSVPSSTKGKRSERDRDGKGHSREILFGNGNNKIGRPALSNAKGERKSKSKPKQKTTQLSEQPKPALLSELKSNDMPSNSNTKRSNSFGFESLEDPGAIDLSNLQLPGIDALGASDDFGGHGQDLDSWLNIDDDGLQDLDLMGLEIPMDDLSDLNMMV